MQSSVAKPNYQMADMQLPSTDKDTDSETELFEKDMASQGT